MVNPFTIVQNGLELESVDAIIITIIIKEIVNSFTQDKEIKTDPAVSNIFCALLH